MARKDQPHNMCSACGVRIGLYDDFCSTCEADGTAEGFREGQRAALEGMDLPDGAYHAMAEEMGIEAGEDFDG